jgi:hypothetical protein
MHVLSSSVGHAFQFLEKADYLETAKFCLMFDRFFDCLNTTSIEEGKHKRKANLALILVTRMLGLK